MKKHIKLLILSLITLNLMGSSIAADCEIPYARHNIKGVYKDDIKSMAREERLDKAIKVVQRLKSRNRTDRRLDRKIIRRLEVNESRIISGRDHYKPLTVTEYERTLTALSNLSYKMESSYLIVNKYQKIFDAIERASTLGSKGLKQAVNAANLPTYLKDDVLRQIKSSMSVADYLKDVRKIIRKYERRIGQNYFEYTTIGQHLENLRNGIDCNAACVKKVKAFTSEMNELVNNRIKSLPQKYKSRERIPSLKKLKAYSEINSAVRVIHKKKVLINEALDVVAPYFRKVALFSSFYHWAASRITINKGIITKLFKAYYNKKGIQDRGRLNKFIRSVESIDIKMKFIKEEIENNVSFAINLRRQQGDLSEKLWQDLKSRAKKNEPELFKRLEKIGKMADKFGRIPPRIGRNATEVAVVTLIAGGGLYFYANFDSEETREISEIDGVIVAAEEPLPNQPAVTIIEDDEYQVVATEDSENAEIYAEVEEDEAQPTVDASREEAAEARRRATERAIEEAANDDVTVITSYEKSADKAVTKLLDTVIGEIDAFNKK